VAWVHERTIPTERPQLVREVTAKFADIGCQMVSVTDPYGRILGYLERGQLAMAWSFHLPGLIYKQLCIDYPITLMAWHLIKHRDNFIFLSWNTEVATTHAHKRNDSVMTLCFHRGVSKKCRCDRVTTDWLRSRKQKNTFQDWRVATKTAPIDGCLGIPIAITESCLTGREQTMCRSVAP
jgi:hypothetical protein